VYRPVNNQPTNISQTMSCRAHKSVHFKMTVFWDVGPCSLVEVDTSIPLSKNLIKKKQSNENTEQYLTQAEVRVAQRHNSNSINYYYRIYKQESSERNHTKISGNYKLFHCYILSSKGQ
jgi:hypothetical protein